MCYEYFVRRKKTSDTVDRSKEQVDALLRQITSDTAMRKHQPAPTSESKPSVEREKETA